MIRRITLENYMSHALTVIEPAAGLTVLVGPNNCGKSAVISALQTLCGDLAGDFMVRHGEKLCTVTVETDDSHTVTWRRKGSAVSYTLDGKDVHRSGRGNLPDNLHEHLRLPKVEPSAGGDPFDIHFGLQKSPIFLIDQPSRAAMFFSTSNDAERLLEIQKIHKDKKQNAKTEHKRLTGEIADADEQLLSLAPLDSIGESLEVLEKDHGDLLAATVKIEELRRNIGELERRERECERLGAIKSEFAAMQSPPQPHDTPELALLISRLGDGAGKLDRLRAVGAALATLAGPPAQKEIAPLAEVIFKLGRATSTLARKQAEHAALSALRNPPLLDDEIELERLCFVLDAGGREFAQRTLTFRWLKSLQEAPTIHDREPLASLVKRFDRAARASERARAAVDVCILMTEPPSMATPDALQQFAAAWQAAQEKSARCHALVTQVTDQLSAIERDISRWVSENPQCPVCGGATTREQLLTGGHRHG